MGIGIVAANGGQSLSRAGGFTGDITQRVHYFDDFVSGTSAIQNSVNTAIKTDGVGGVLTLTAAADADAMTTTAPFIDMTKPFAVEFRVKPAAITDAFVVGLSSTDGFASRSVYGTISGSEVSAYATNRDSILIGTEFGSTDGQLKIAENNGSGAPPTASIDGKNIVAGEYIRLGFYGDSTLVNFTVDGDLALQYEMTETVSGPLSAIVNVAEGALDVDWIAATGERT